MMKNVDSFLMRGLFVCGVCALLCSSIPAATAQEPEATEKTLRIIAEESVFIDLLNPVAAELSQQDSGLKLVLVKQPAETCAELLKSGEFKVLITSVELSDLPPDATCVEFALSGKIFAIHPKNSIGNMSVEAVNEILSGKSLFWNPAQKDRNAIHVFRTDKAAVFLDDVDEHDDKKDASKSKIDEYVSADKEQTASMVNMDLLSFGIFELADCMRKDMKWIKVNGITPTFDNALSGKYPFAKKYFLYTRPHKTSLDFVEYLKGRYFSAILLSNGILPLAQLPPELRAQ